MSLASFSAIDISQPNSTPLSNATASNESGESLRNEFLTLMVAQLQNQNPLEPMDGAEYVSQLAEFTQVDSAETLNRLMQSNTVTLGNLQSLAVADLVGKSVVVATDQVDLGAEPIQAFVQGPASALPVEVMLSDQFGNQQTAMVDLRNGYAEFSLDRDQIGLSGLINIEFVNRSDLRMAIQGNVDSVRLQPNGDPTVRVAGVGDVPLYQLIQFGE